VTLHPELDGYIRERVLPAVDAIPADRTQRLAELATAIRRHLDDHGHADVLFICTHNSRRSHFGQVWAHLAAAWHDVEHVTPWSGGTEATAFDPRAVAALERAGFRVSRPDGSLDNPRYEVAFSPDLPPLVCFSKTYDDPHNPRSGFVAVMTCSEADEACPVVHGASARVAVPYEDPRAADGTPEETARYDERCLQIAAEMFHAMAHV